MARVVLEAGRDVVVPQLLAREAFILELEQLADTTGSQFIEVALMISSEEMKAWFAERSAAPTATVHQDAQALVGRLGGDAALEGCTPTSSGS